MVDSDLALLYGVSTKNLNKAVKRNIGRFPSDFMFEIDGSEVNSLRFQFGTSNKPLNLATEIEKGGRGGRRYSTYVFTEQGIAMLSSILNSDRAIQVNIQIIRVFTKLREMVDTYKDLREKVEEMERNNETNFKEIFRILRAVMEEEEKPKKQIGFT